MKQYQVRYHRTTMLVKGQQKEIPEFVIEYDDMDEMSSYERSMFDCMEVFDELVWEGRTATFTFTPSPNDDNT